MKGRTNTGGGGGTSLNFDVKAYATEEALLAATPKENTIGIITETNITNWIFSPVEPAEPVEGMAWITVSTGSNTEFNALKKNAIQVYPLSAKQYVGGAWVAVTAMSYQRGEWVEWIIYLFNNGDQCKSITGGWTSSGYAHGTTYTKASPTIGDTIVVKVTSSGYYSIAGTVNKIDVTYVNTIYAIAKTVSSGVYLRLLDSTKNTSTGSVAGTEFKDNIATLDVSSLTGEYYICFSCIGTTSVTSRNGTITEVWCEV